MAGKRGLAGARLLALRAEREQNRGGNTAKSDAFARSAPDALAAAWTDGGMPTNFQERARVAGAAAVRLQDGWLLGKRNAEHHYLSGS